MSYRGANVFILAFSLISRPSFENIGKKWAFELQHYAPNVPVVLVGTKLDLRENKFPMNDPGACTTSIEHVGSIDGRHNSSEWFIADGYTNGSSERFRGEEHRWTPQL
ncbi:hypothetical protein F2Q69_00053864, partial [Brassica cretica]